MVQRERILAGHVHAKRIARRACGKARRDVHVETAVVTARHINASFRNLRSESRECEKPLGKRRPQHARGIEFHLRLRKPVVAHRHAHALPPAWKDVQFALTHIYRNARLGAQWNGERRRARFVAAGHARHRSAASCEVDGHHGQVICVTRLARKKAYRVRSGDCERRVERDRQVVGNRQRVLQTQLERKRAAAAGRRNELGSEIARGRNVLQRHCKEPQSPCNERDVE